MVLRCEDDLRLRVEQALADPRPARAVRRLNDILLLGPPLLVGEVRGAVHGGLVDGRDRDCIF